MEHFDVIVVGAGSSGGVLAARLAERGVRVLLLEAGPDFPDEAELPPLFAVSGEHSWLVAGIPEFDWRYWNSDGAGTLGGRRVRLARGRLVGGTSMVNATIAARGAAFDYDRWASFGNPGWAWADLLPYFIGIENDLDFGDRPFHGASGPIPIRRYRRESWAPVNAALYDGCAALGFSETPDLNAPGADAGVFGPMPHNRYKEVRQGTLVTYLRAVRGRDTLEIRPHMLVDRVVLSGSRATGVRAIGPGGAAVELGAELVVLSAGVYGSPAILQRSGIGPAAVLRGAGVRPVLDLPAGRNLRDHPGCGFLFSAPALAGVTGRFFATNCRGPADENGEPAWQTHPVPIDEEEGVAGFWTYLPRSDADGTVEIAGTDPAAPPRIDHRYLTSDADVRRFTAAWAFCRELLDTPPFRRAGARWLADTPVAERLQDGVGSANHQVGTCRMGPAGDPRAVVGADLRVHGTEGLMVADASIFPDDIMHNTNLTCLVVGEIAADLITGARAAPAAG